MKLGHETGDSNLSPCKKSWQDFLKEIANISLRQWIFFWKTHWIQSVEGNIWSSTAACSHSVNLRWGWGFYVNFEVLSDLKVQLKIFSKSNWKNGSWDWQQSFWPDESWIPIPFVVLFCCIHWWCSFLCNEAVEDVDTSEAGGQKEQKGRVRFRSWEFLQETSVRFGCQMPFPPFAVEKWIRIVDSFQIFLPKSFGIIFCIFQSRFFFGADVQVRTDALSLETPLQEGSSLYDLRDVWGNQSQGCIHFFNLSIDQSRSIQYWNPKVVRFLYRAEDLSGWFQVQTSEKWSVLIWCCCIMKVSWRKQGEICGKRMVKWENMPMKRTRPEGMTAFPRHLSNCVPQNICLRCFSWRHIIWTNGNVHGLFTWVHDL